MTADELMNMTVTQVFMGKVLGLTQGRISQLLDEGILIRDEESRQVRLMESVRSYYLSKNATGDGVNFWKERGLHEKAKRELAELKLSERKGELYESATVERVLSELFINFRNRLQGMGHKLAGRLEGLTAAQISAIIDSEIEDNLEELSTGSKELSYEDSGVVESNPVELSETDT
jgi:predicted transcriptional regulator